MVQKLLFNLISKKYFLERETVATKQCTPTVFMFLPIQHRRHLLGLDASEGRTEKIPSPPTPTSNLYACLSSHTRMGSEAITVQHVCTHKSINYTHTHTHLVRR